MKLTISEEIKRRKIRKQGPLVSWAFHFLASFLYRRKSKFEVDRQVDLKKYKDTPIIVVCNHASRVDYAFCAMALKNRRLNIVAAENEFHRSHLQFLFKLGQVIPKKNFVTDITTIKGITRIIKKEKNGCVCLWPSGMLSFSGAQQPAMPGTGKLLKKLGVPVLAVRTHGDYMFLPQFEAKERSGKVKAEMFELFSPEQLQQLDEDAIQEKLDEALFADDFAWNEIEQNSYKSANGPAYRLHHVLYKCPACGEEMQMEGKGNTIVCLKCGNGATLDDKYNLVPFKGSRVPKNIRAWCDNQRRDMRRKCLSPDFAMEEHVKIGVLKDYEIMTNYETCEVVGEGTLRLDKTGLTYIGTRNDQPWSVFIKWDLLKSIVLPIDATFFYTYASGEYLQFIPDKATCTRWNLAVEEVHRTNGGVWQNFKWFDYDHDEKLIEGK